MTTIDESYTLVSGNVIGSGRFWKVLEKERRRRRIRRRTTTKQQQRNEIPAKFLEVLVTVWVVGLWGCAGVCVGCGVVVVVGGVFGGSGTC